MIPAIGLYRSKMVKLMSMRMESMMANVWKQHMDRDLFYRLMYSLAMLLNWRKSDRKTAMTSTSMVKKMILKVIKIRSVFFDGYSQSCSAKTKYSAHVNTDAKIK